MTKRLVTLIASALLGFASTAGGAPVEKDLTTVGTSVTVNGAIFFVPPTAYTAGSGLIDSFVRIGAPSNAVQGYNTSDRPLQFDENPSPTFTKDLLLANVPKKWISGTEYYEFLLDINQTGADPLLSLDRVQLFSGADQATDASSYTSPGNTSNLGTLEALSAPIYSLDSASTDNYIKLDFGNYSGSGQTDMFMFVPVASFVAGPNVYLYSRFGDNENNNDGFEEWAVREAGAPETPCPTNDCLPPSGVPEPGTLALVALGLLGAGLTSARRRKT